MGRLSNESIPDFHLPKTEKLQIGDHRLSTSFGVVEQPDHHCGDDLVINTMVKPEILLIEWQQNHMAPWLPESAIINIVVYYFSSEAVQFVLK